MVGMLAPLALLAGLAAAYHAPVGSSPQGNPITAPLNNVVPVGIDYTITWTPTSTNKVSLLLLKGPSTNAVYYETIVENIANSGSYTWKPETTLADTDGKPLGYGIQLIDDTTGFYQYSTQFGIKNDKVSVSSSASASASASAGGYGYSTAVPATSSIAAYSSAAPVQNSTVVYPTSVKTSVYVASTGYPVQNSTIIQPTGSLTVPSSLKTSATGTAATGTKSPTASAPVGTGAASPLRAGLGLAGAMAAAVFVL